MNTFRSDFFPMYHLFWPVCKLKKWYRNKIWRYFVSIIPKKIWHWKDEKMADKMNVQFSTYLFHPPVDPFSHISYRLGDRQCNYFRQSWLRSNSTQQKIPIYSSVDAAASWHILTSTPKTKKQFSKYQNTQWEYWVLILTGTFVKLCKY